MGSRRNPDIPYLHNIEKRYIELEISRYHYYKQILELMKNDKDLLLISSLVVMHMQILISAVDRVMKRCSADHLIMLNDCLLRNHYTVYELSIKQGYSIETGRRYKRWILENVAKELGIMK